MHVCAFTCFHKVFAWGRGYGSGMEGAKHSPHMVPISDEVRVSPHSTQLFGGKILTVCCS